MFLLPSTGDGSYWESMKMKTLINTTVAVNGLSDKNLGGHLFTDQNGNVKPQLFVHLAVVKDRFSGQRQIYHSPQRKYDFPSTSVPS